MRVRAIDWVRGLVVMLMTIDHAGSIFDSAHPVALPLVTSSCR
jgi:uncharacterized membrane protein